MDRSDVVSLIAQTFFRDEIGQEASKETKRDVFCNVSSITRNEWFGSREERLSATGSASQCFGMIIRMNALWNLKASGMRYTVPMKAKMSL